MSFSQNALETIQNFEQEVGLEADSKNIYLRLQSILTINSKIKEWLESIPKIASNLTSNENQKEHQSEGKIGIIF